MCVLLFYFKSRDVILNYPPGLTSGLILAIFVLLWLLNFKSQVRWILPLKKQLDSENKVVGYISLVILSTVISWIILIPFNYLLISHAKKQSEQTFYCQVTGGSTYNRFRRIYFELNGKTETIYKHHPAMYEMDEKKSFDQFYIVIEVRKSLFSTYILESWDIKRKS